LEAGDHPVIWVNPRQRKAVPGQKTALADRKWLAARLRHGRLKASFIPPVAIRAVGEVLR